MGTMVAPLPHKDGLRIKLSEACDVILGGSGVEYTVNNVGCPIALI